MSPAASACVPRIPTLLALPRRMPAQSVVPWPHYVAELLRVRLPRTVPGPRSRCASRAPLCGLVRSREGAPHLSPCQSTPAPPRTPLAPARRPRARSRPPPASPPGSLGARWAAQRSTTLSPRPPRPWQVPLRRDSRLFASRQGASPGPAQSRPRSPSHRPPPSPTAAARSRLRLRPSPRPLPPPSPLSRDCVRVRAQASFCARRGPVEDPPHPLRRADDPPAAPSRRRLHHTHSLPLSHHSHLPPHPFPPSQPHSPTAPRASRHPTPLTLGATPRAAVWWPSYGVVASMCLV